MFVKELTLLGFIKNAIFRRGRGSQKKQNIAGLPKRGKLRKYADLRGSWRKRRGGAFEVGLIL